MKKAWRAFLCVILICACSAAVAETILTEEFLTDLFERCSVEELFGLYDRLLEELSLRQYSEEETYTFIANKNSDKFHLLGCQSVRQITAKNRLIYIGDREELIALGYEPCGGCNP